MDVSLLTFNHDYSSWMILCRTPLSPAMGKGHVTQDDRLIVGMWDKGRSCNPANIVRSPVPPAWLLVNPGIKLRRLILALLSGLKP